MKRLLPVLVALFGLCVWGQERPKDGAAAEAASERAQAAHGGPSAEAKETSAEEENPAVQRWKWANFAILVVGLGYLIGKSAPPFFRARTEQIQQGIAEASRIKKDAEARAGKIELRLTRLEQEIEHIRTEARQEMTKEHDRLVKETDHHMARIQAQAEQEISAITKHATLELKAYGAQLAVDLAEQRIRARMDQSIEQALVDRFVRQIDRQGPEARL